MKIAAVVLLAVALGHVGVCGAAEIEPIIPKSVPTVRLVQDKQPKAVLYEEDANDPNGRQFVGSTGLADRPRCAGWRTTAGTHLLFSGTRFVAVVWPEEFRRR
jgi:hypothetical protein